VEMADQQPVAPARARIFIGSSTRNLDVARTLADCLERRKFQPQVWDEGRFNQNESVLDGLLRIAKDVDFAVFVWGPSDVTTSNGETVPSPRDNVVFETGLFLGALGKDRVFIVVDKTVSVKIPSDYKGITVTEYDGSLMETDEMSAVRSACNAIAKGIQSLAIASHLSVLAGEWKSRYASGPDAEHREVMDDVVIKAEPEGISFSSGPVHGLVAYSAEGRVYYRNQIIGQWTHPSDKSMAEGLFMLTVSPTADAMYGYSTSRDVDGAMIYGTWVFAKKDGRAEDEIMKTLLWAQRRLKERTISPPVDLDK